MKPLSLKSTITWLTRSREAPTSAATSDWVSRNGMRTPSSASLAFSRAGSTLSLPADLRDGNESVNEFTNDVASLA